MVHVVPKFKAPLEVTAHEDGVVVSSKQGLDMVLTPDAADATAERLNKGAEEVRQAQSATAPDDSAEA